MGAGLRLLLVAAAAHGAIGLDCWNEAFPERLCCNLAAGPGGSPDCWQPPHLTYENCCNATVPVSNVKAEILDASDANSFAVLTQLLGANKGIAPLLAGLKRRESLSPRLWWRGQLQMLRAAEAARAPFGYVAEPEALRQLPLISFGLLLDALLPSQSRNRVAVNLGAADGKKRDPVYPLYRDYGYGGLALEASEAWRSALEANLAPLNRSGTLHAVIGKVQPEQLPALLGAYGLPMDFDVLKIDVDSTDAELLRAVLDAAYRPKIICIEVNPDIPPPFRVEFQPGGYAFHSNRMMIRRGSYGASADALYSLLSGERGYSLVGFELLAAREEQCPHCEHNMWFVRNDLLGLPRTRPLVSWWGMVRLFWAQHAFTNFACLHLFLTSNFCPIYQMDAYAPLLGLRRDFHPAIYSLALALPDDTARLQAQALSSALQGHYRRACLEEAEQSCKVDELSPEDREAVCPNGPEDHCYANVGTTQVPAARWQDGAPVLPLFGPESPGRGAGSRHAL